ncbi:MAG TPA: 30S ribosomal protein S4 [Dissulfurispiraceae bacterium]
MSPKKTPRHKVSRRFGIDIYGTGGPSLQRRIEVPPGGLRMKRGHESDYARQMKEKQKVKYLYGIREKQFRRYFETARHAGGPTGRVLLELLERRLDNIVYRLGFSRTRPMARHLVSTGHVRVNGKRVTIPSYLVRPGETVSLTPPTLEIPGLREEMEIRKPTVTWLNRSDGAGEMTALPNRDEVDGEIDESLVVGFYSR